jgi:2-phosphosulfolactate phosphatase
MKRLEVLLTPAEFERLKPGDLSQTVCVVFDVLRATSSMVTALGHGGTRIFPVANIAQALELKSSNPGILLAGERNGLRIGPELTGGVPFDLGNSPAEFTPQVVKGRTIAMTTTNGTRALQACSGAQAVLLGSFLNLTATVNHLRQVKPDRLLAVCSGTFEDFAYEDALGAGALCDALWNDYQDEQISDSARIARELYNNAKANIPAALLRSCNGRRLARRASLANDVAFCAQRDLFGLVAQMGPEGGIAVAAA